MAKVKLMNAKYTRDKVAKVKRDLPQYIPYISLLISVIAILKAYNVLF